MQQIPQLRRGKVLITGSTTKHCGIVKPHSIIDQYVQRLSSYTFSIKIPFGENNHYVVTITSLNSRCNSYCKHMILATSPLSMTHDLFPTLFHYKNNQLHTRSNKHGEMFQGIKRYKLTKYTSIVSRILQRVAYSLLSLRNEMKLISGISGWSKQAAKGNRCLLLHLVKDYYNGVIT